MKKHNFYKAAGILGIIALIGGMVFTNLSCKKEPEVYKIGTILPLTGDKAAYGERARKGFELALEDIRKEMPKLKLEILYEDSKFEVKEAVSAYHKLKSIHNIPVVITLSSGVSLAIAPLSNHDKIFQMAIVASTPDYTSPGDFTFRTTARAEVEDKELAKAVVPRYKKVALLYNNNERGIGHRNAIKGEIEKLGGEIVVEEAISPKGRDYRDNLVKIKGKNPEAVYLLTESKNIGIILKQAKELGIEAQFFGTRSTEHREVISIAEEAAEGIIYTFSFDPESTDPLIKDIVERYKIKYGETPDYVFAEAYDALRLTAKSLNKCGAKPDCMKKYLFETKNYKGLLGLLTFDENGDVYYPYRLKTIKNGQFVSYEE